MDIGEGAAMLLKLFGVVMVVVGCGGVGFRIAANHRHEEKALRQLIGILDYMECELQYRLTTLPVLCRQVAKEYPQILGKVFYAFALEMETQVSPDLNCCMAAALDKNKEVPSITREGLELLGKSIGRFDLDGQLMGLEAVRQECRRNLEELSNNREMRLRSYQTLGLCAGAALAILFV